jgi:hypothetical protein
MYIDIILIHPQDHCAFKLLFKTKRAAPSSQVELQRERPSKHLQTTCDDLDPIALPSLVSTLGDKNQIETMRSH